MPSSRKRHSMDSYLRESIVAIIAALIAKADSIVAIR